MRLGFCHDDVSQTGSWQPWRDSDGLISFSENLINDKRRGSERSVTVPCKELPRSFWLWFGHNSDLQ